MSDRTTAFDDMDFSDVVSEPSSIAASNKKKKSAFDDMDFSDVVAAPSIAAKPYSRRGSVEARNKAAETPVFGERGWEFQQNAAIDAATTPALGTAASRAQFAKDVALKAGEMGVQPAADSASPEVRAAMERVAPSGQLLPLLNNPEVIASKFKSGWRAAEAGAALLEYNTTGRVTIGGDSGDALDRYADGGGPTYLEGAAAEKYIRELASPNADDATSAAFDSVSSMGTRAAANALAQPESILSLAGGMVGGGMGSAVGMLPTAFKAMGSEYLQNLRNGASHEAALANAIAKMGVEAGTEWLGGKYGGEGGAVRSIVSEGAEEGVAQVGGYGVDAVSGALADNSAAFYEKLPKTWGEGLSQTAEAVATGSIAAGALRAITAAPALALSGVEAARKLLDSKERAAPTEVPRAPAGPIPVDPWTSGPRDVVPPAQPAAEPVRATATKPTAESLITQLMTPAEKAKFDKLKDPEQRRAMIDSADEKRAQIAAAMAENAADRDWVSKNDITTHPTFAAIEAAVRGGATSQAKLKEAVPGASRIITKAAIDHLEKAGVVSPPDKQRRRTVLAPASVAPVDAGAIKSNIDSAILPSVQPASQPAVQDNIVEQKNSVTLPEGGRSLPQEPEVVNTPAPAQTETVQKSPRVEPKGPIRLRPPAPVAVAPAVERAPEPAEAGGATTLPAPTQNAPVAPAVQAQTPSEVVPPVAGLTPETKKRRQAAAKKSAPATPVVEPPAYPALDTAWVSSADPEDVDIWKGTHDAHAKRDGKNPEDTYVGQVLRGITPTVAPTADDGAFAEKMKLRIPEAPPTVAATGAVAPQQAEDTVPAPTAEATPVIPSPKPKSKLVIKQEKEAAAREVARVAAEETAKAEEARIAAKIPSDAELAMSGMSPGEIALAKKTKPQEIFDAVSRGEISTPQGMRPVTDADIAAAKTRPDKERLTKLKAKYEQATDAPRKLPPATITNVRKEAIARAYERIKAMAQSPNMSQFDAIPSDPESTKAILGLQAAAQNSPTTEAELAKKLEDQYVENYKRNHPEATEIEAEPVVEAAASPVPQGVFNVVAPGVFATSQVSESLRGLTAMWRDILKIGPHVYITTFADLEANKAQFTGEYTRILSLNRGAGTNGIKAVLADGSYIIALNPTLTTSQTLEVLGHELGHAHQEIAFDNADDATKRLLYTAYDAWARDNAQSSNSAKQLVITRAPRSLGRKISASARPGMTVGHLSNPTYWRSFNEWYADQVARWATTSDVPLTAVEKFFSRLGMAMRAFFNKARNARYLPDPSFSAYMAAVTKTAKDATSQSNKAGTISSIEEMAAITTPAEKPLTDTEKGVGTLNRVADAVIGLARNRGIASQDAQDMIESRHGIMEAMRVEGESAIEQVKQEMVDALRGASAATRETYKENLLKYLHGDTTVPLPASLKQRIAELRKLMDDRSLAMVAMGLVPKDKIRTVLENIGKWTHRDFKVFNLEPGRNNHPGEYKKLVMKLAKHGRRDIVKEVVADVVEAMRVPDAATLNALIASAKDTGAKDHEDAVATIDLWKRRWRLHSTLSTKEVHKRLLDISKMDEAELQKHAAEYANYMLNPLHENAPADAKADFNRFKQVYADETALSKDRTQIPKWLKTLWGEYTDWETVSVLSLDNQAQILTKFVTMSRYKARLLSQNRAFKSDSNRSKVGYTLLDGKAYGPLNGYYIPDKDLWLIQASTTIDALDVALGARERGGHSLQANLRKIASGVVDVTSTIGAPFKVAQVLASHTTVLINAGVTALILSGAIPNIRGALKAIPNAFKIARASSFADIGIRTSRTGPFKGVGMLGRALENGSELQNQLLFLISHNVLHDAALTADMQRKQHEQLTQEVDAMLDFSARLAKYYANPFHMYRYGKDRLSRLNSAGDEFGKYIMWATRVDGLMAADPSMSEEEAKILAAKHTADTMPSFMKSMPVARVIGNTGLANPFMTFNTEQLRNVYNSLAIAAEFGLKRKGRAAKMYAASELVSTLVRLGGISMYNAIAAGPLLVIMQAATDMLDDDDDEDKKKKEEEQITAGMAWNTGEKYEAIRAALPSHIHGGVQILRDLGDGKYVLTSGQRFDPAMAGALLEAAMYEGDGAFEDVLVDTFAQLAPTLPGLLNVASGYTNLYTAKEDSDAKVQAADQISLGLSQLAKTYTPGSWKTTERTSKAAEQGVELTTREKILNNIGHTVQVFDSHKAASRIAADYNSVQRDAMRDVKDAMEDKEETLDFHAATLRKLALWERAKSKVDNLKAMGMDFGTVWDAVKNDPISKGINKKELVGLYEGTFPLPDYIEIVGNSRKTALVKAGTKPEEVDALYESYLKQADAAEQQMRAILESQGVTVQ